MLVVGRHILQHLRQKSQKSNVVAGVLLCLEITVDPARSPTSSSDCCLIGWLTSMNQLNNISHDTTLINSFSIICYTVSQSTLASVALCNGGGLTYRPRCSNADQISDQLNRVQLWSQIWWDQVTLRCINLNLVQLTRFSWTAILNRGYMWTMLIG